jgi:hypothetical protein
LKGIINLVLVVDAMGGEDMLNADMGPVELWRQQCIGNM